MEIRQEQIELRHALVSFLAFESLFLPLGATVVILGGISYDELDSRVWTREEYDAATIGEQAEHAATTKFFNDRHDARVAAGNKSLLGE